MDITRRTFTLGATTFVALTVLGRGVKAYGQLASSNGPVHFAKKSDRASLPRKPFDAGSPKDYLKPGVYDKYHKTHRTWLVSDGSKLVALLDVCTHLGCELNWSADIELFECPCHTSEFDAQGINQEGGLAKRPMERFAISLAGEKDSRIVRIDPRVRLRKDRDQWNDPRAAIDLPR